MKRCKWCNAILDDGDFCSPHHQEQYNQHARPVYKKHSDKQSGKWNIFTVIGGIENFVTTRNTAAEAQKYCDQKNIGR